MTHRLILPAILALLLFAFLTRWVDKAPQSLQERRDSVRVINQWRTTDSIYFKQLNEKACQ